MTHPPLTREERDLIRAAIDARVRRLVEPAKSTIERSEYDWIPVVRMPSPHAMQMRSAMRVPFMFAGDRDGV